MTSNEGADSNLRTPDDGRSARGEPLRSFRRDWSQEAEVDVSLGSAEAGGGAVGENQASGAARPLRAAEVKRLEDAFLDLAGMVEDLRVALDEEKERHDDLRQAMASEIQRLERELGRKPAAFKIPKLTSEFGGDPKLLRAFLWTTKGFLGDQHHLFPNEEAKVRAIVAQLRDAAGEWAVSLIETGDPALGSADSLLAALERRFHDPTLSRRAWDDLKNVRQGNRSAAEYVDAFRKTANYASDVPERMLIETFVDGLNLELSSWCSHERPPADLHSWYQLVLDGGIALARLKRKTPTVPPKKTTSSQPPRPSPRVSDVERARRFREGLCLRCGESGHRAANCKEKPTPKPSPSVIASTKLKLPSSGSARKPAASSAELVAETPEASHESGSEEESGNGSGPE